MSDSESPYMVVIRPLSTGIKPNASFLESNTGFYNYFIFSYSYICCCLYYKSKTDDYLLLCFCKQVDVRQKFCVFSDQLKDGTKIMADYSTIIFAVVFITKVKQMTTSCCAFASRSMFARSSAFLATNWKMEPKVMADYFTSTSWPVHQPGFKFRFTRSINCFLNRLRDHKVITSPRFPSQPTRCSYLWEGPVQSPPTERKWINL